jgi:hypothetical protein
MLQVGGTGIEEVEQQEQEEEEEEEEEGCLHNVLHNLVRRVDGLEKVVAVFN